MKLYWRDIAGNLNSNVRIKVQLRVQLKIFLDSDLNIIRSLSNVQIVCNNYFTNLYNNFKANLYLLIENYGELFIENFILFYNICHVESILKKSIITLNKKNMS